MSLAPTARIVSMNLFVQDELNHLAVAAGGFSL
jgi:hypothetical protein